MRVLDSVFIQAFLILIISIDLTMTIVTLALDMTRPSNEDEPAWIFVTTIIIVSLLLIEVLFRLFGLGARSFFSKWFNRWGQATSRTPPLSQSYRPPNLTTLPVPPALCHLLSASRKPSVLHLLQCHPYSPTAPPSSSVAARSLDLGVSVLSMALELVVFATFQHAQAILAANATTHLGGDSAAASDLALLRVLRPMARISRVLRFATRAFSQHKKMGTAARHIVGGNKRRFRQSGFDLDLVYVTEKVIGMSVPAIGGMSLYRNPIDEVARFFRTYHPNSFMLFNCTAE